MRRRRRLFTLAYSAGLALADQWMVRRLVDSRFITTPGFVMASRIAAW